MVICSAFNCKSRSEKKDPGITFHRFPKNLNKRQLWVNNMKIAGWSPTKNDRICSKHFESHLFYHINHQTRLEDDAVPTIFLELPTYLQPKQAMKRPSPSRVSVQLVASPSTTIDTQPKSDEDSPRKKKLRRQLFTETKRSQQKSRRIKMLSQTIRRTKKKIISLQEIVKELAKRNLLSSESSLLFENMPDISKDIHQRKLSKKATYSAELRKFAITLCFFSPKGYDYVRKVFDTCLPHRSTIGKWLKNVDAGPGFTAESFDILKKYVDISDKPTILALVVDEMSIRKHVEWDGKQMQGYVFYGVDLQDDQNVIAKEAFVLMAVCINGSWKLPVGYFFVDGLNGAQKSSLVSQCIQLITKTGAHLYSVTFDGAPSNITMTNVLGCKTEINTTKTYFTINNSNNIYIFYDPCHMVKLIRNCFGENQVLIDDQGNFIQWDYIVKLEELQTSEGLHLGNKLRKSHIQFFKQKMKVRLAVQLLSESVADALSFCEDTLKLEGFKGCAATVRFIKMINASFDILNSRSLAAPGYKKAIFHNNVAITKTFVCKAHDYISNLKFPNGDLVVSSRRKTGFIGLIISLKNALLMYEDLISNKLLIYFPCYKVSQDHLELFFSSIRSRCGWNNNPTCRQCTAAYKRLLVRAEIREGGMGNCIPLDDIPILSGSSRFEQPELNIARPDLLQDTVDNYSNGELQTIWQDHDYIMNHE